jgi:hypothetical protein
MPRVSAAFFVTGALCILMGGAIGMHMAASRDSVYAGMHVHLNLVGWATMALCGTFYALTGKTMLPWLAWTNYLVLTAGIVIFFPAFALFLAHGNDPQFEPFMKAGNGLTGLGMLIFTVAALRELFRKRA